MAKFFAVTIFVIAIASAIPILRHTWWMAPDISTHGAPIDEQMSETMAEAGISFLASQIILALFHLEIFQPASRREDQELPRWGQGYGLGSLPPGWDGSSGVGSVRSQGLG